MSPSALSLPLKPSSSSSSSTSSTPLSEPQARWFACLPEKAKKQQFSSEERRVLALESRRVLPDCPSPHFHRLQPDLDPLDPNDDDDGRKSIAPTTVHAMVRAHRAHTASSPPPAADDMNLLARYLPRCPFDRLRRPSYPNSVPDSRSAHSRQPSDLASTVSVSDASDSPSAVPDTRVDRPHTPSTLPRVDHPPTPATHPRVDHPPTHPPPPRPRPRLTPLPFPPPRLAPPIFPSRLASVSPAPSPDLWPAYPAFPPCATQHQLPDQLLSTTPSHPSLTTLRPRSSASSLSTRGPQTPPSALHAPEPAAKPLPEPDSLWDPDAHGLRPGTAAPPLSCSGTATPLSCPGTAASAPAPGTFGPAPSPDPLALAALPVRDDDPSGAHGAFAEDKARCAKTGTVVGVGAVTGTGKGMGMGMGMGMGKARGLRRAWRGRRVLGGS